MTLPPLPIEIRPPAQCGDIARAAADGAVAIGLADGLFETTASPWHKEILWAMSRGVRVYGAASMGALRAAEMHQHGMIGVGRIFAMYRDGRLVDDDEVAISHGPAEAGYPAVSEAMVNIRATLALARRRDVIDAMHERRLLAIAKALFFKDRGYAQLLAAARRLRLPGAMLRRLAAWLPHNRRDIKREDALLLLRRVSQDARRSVPSPRPGFVATTFWDALARRLDLPRSQS